MEGVQLLFACFAILFPMGSRAQPYPFQNTSLPFEDRVEDLVGRLTLNELVAQMAHGGAQLNGPAPAIERLGIKPYQWGTECLSGDVAAGNATSFPMALGMAATFHYDMVHSVAKATSDEVRAKNTDAIAHGSYKFHTGLSCWSPVLNILRDPRWGRNQETYGEDPWLSGYLGRAFVTGLQGDHPRYVEANAGCKHFDVHGGPENIPVSRFSFNAVVSMRDWRMTFLPQFKACVDAGSWSLMCSYNSIDGIPACANRELLTNILRDEWGFKGYVVSDQGALENIMREHHYTDDPVETAAAAANSGTCLEDGNMYHLNIFDNLGDAVNQSLVTMEQIKDAVSRLFLVRMKLGEFDPPDMNPYTKIKLDVIQSDAHRELSLRAALESVVLLKNDDLRGLPLKASVQSVCVIGPFMDDYEVLFGDYSPTIMPDYVVTPLKGITKNIKLSQVTSAKGCSDGPACKTYDKDEVVKSCTGVDMIIATAGISRYLESEGRDRADINLPGNQLQMLQDAAAAAATSPMVLVLFNAGPLDISWAKSSDQVVSIVEMFYPAQAAGDALSKVLTGEYNPAGRLPNTWPASLDQVPPITNYTMENRTYRYINKTEPLYPFGYGLSYTQFNYSSFKVPDSIGLGKNLTASVTVTNTGKQDGDEVVQLYLHWLDPSIPAPVRQLVGVNRTHIAAGSSVTMAFTVVPDQMAVWTDRWTQFGGKMRLTVGGQQPEQATSSPSNVLEAYFTVNS